MFVSGSDLLAQYKKSAMRKARNLGCIIDICDDCATQAELNSMFLPAPFKVTVSKDCGCGGTNVPERG